MLIKLWYGKSGEVKQKPYKKQPDFDDAKPEGIDFISPSIIRETLPKELSAEGIKMTDYAVEVGGTAVPVRYYRSFFAQISAGNTWAGMLDSLVVGDFGEADMDFAIHVRPSANDRELDAIGRRITGLLSDLASEKDVSKRDSMMDEVKDLKARQGRIRRNTERSYRVSIQAIASGTDWKALKKYCNSLVKRFSGKSIILRSADGRQLDALRAILPLTTSEVPKEHFLSFETSNVADLFPFGYGGISHRTGIILGREIFMGKPVFLENWHPDLTNQHACVIGRSGAGKTYVVMTLVNRNTHIRRRVGILDWKGEYRDYMIAMNCPFIELSQHSQDRINPYDVDITEMPDGSRYVDIEEAANFVQALVYKMISVYDRNILTGEVKVFISNSIRTQYEDAEITEDPESLFTASSTGDGKFRIGRTYKKMPELNGLHDMMEKSDKEAVRIAADIFIQFTKTGKAPSMSIFDGQSTVSVKDAPIFAIALNRLDKDIMRPLGLVAAQRWITEKWAKKNPDIKKLEVIEEAQNIFNDPDVGGVWAESSYREGRSTNTGIISVTQGLEVYTKSAAGIAAIKNSPIKIIGLQEKIDIDSVQGMLNLSEGEAHFLVNQASRGKVVLKIDNESTILQVQATKFEHMLFTTDPNDPAYAQRKIYIRDLLEKRNKSVNQEQTG
ncbi:DUF87 domain-containing protein [Paenibacillus sp. S3N08]|uniref:DUF87 domain-containing protein n=2 Tax=Paenibacillus agricola TaxID=2716264 RepID=A0ABX0JED4_9BACL|nr:DUF87 domain-containing protein [Paenibacillus agricola]